MRILIICCLFFLVSSCNSKKTDEKDKENTTKVSGEENTDQKKAEDIIRAYATQHSKGKPADFNFGKLEKNNGQYPEETFVIQVSFKESYEDGGSPANMNHTYFLDKDLNVVRVEYN